MSNQERIQKWLARRETRALQVTLPVAPDSDFATRCRAAGREGVGIEPAPIGAALAMVLGLLAQAPEMSAADRRVVYAAMQAGQEEGIAALELSEDAADLYRRRLRSLIRLLEHDLRAGAAVHQPGYEPAGLAALDHRLLEGYAKRVQLRQAGDARDARRRASELDIPFEVDLPAAEARERAELRRDLARLHSTQSGRNRTRGWSRMAAFVPLLTLQLHLINQESRIAPLWMLVGPVVLLCIISSLYFLTGVHFIMGMDVATFSLLGATTWIMVRQVILRSSGTYVSSRSLLNLESVSPLLLALVQVFIYIVIYGLVLTLLILIGHSLGLITLPVDWKGVAAYFALMGTGGAAIGLLFGAVATRWPYFLRFGAVIERFLQLFASVFFVSEQLPEVYRGYVLWSPFAHGMQLLRSSYFSGYSSSDASLPYLLTALVLLGALGLGAERLVRCDVQPM
ncbi:ABC transporter permease [Achromobacter seleniivolatilans]|uniref:ABC transporter permease n=1 Tax=Achromobacter seleniivolatilans TaxID=3047478 RepID=A0ABY9M1C5_9BURK|nr:ABC transporter permease [Achromobacter sp. R39]WMD20799.1 ABC transporter permease [Achromobacter sp. R39]